MGFCTQCGYQFSAPANFCPRCGAPNASAPGTPSTSAPGPVTEVEERTIARPDLAAPPPTQPYAAPPPPTQPLPGPAPHTAPRPAPAGEAPPPTGSGPGLPPAAGTAQPGSTMPEAVGFAWDPTVLRAVAGVAALTVSWVLNWSAHHPGAYRLAILAILLAIVGGALGFIPGVRQSLPNAAAIGMLALAPLGILIVYTLLRSLIPSSGGGMESRDRPGAGMALAAVGAVLVVQTLLPGAPQALGVLWKRLCIGLLCASSLWGLIGALGLFESTLSSLDSLGFLGFVLVLTMLVIIVTPLWFAVQIARDRSPDWAAGLVLGLAIVAGYAVMTIAEETQPGDIGGALTLFFVGLAAGSAGPVAALMRPPLVGADRWIQTVAGVLVLCAVGLAMATLIALGSLTVDLGNKGSLAVSIVVSLAGCIGAIVCRQLLVDHSPSARLATVIWAGALALLGTVVQFSSDSARGLAFAYTREYVFTMLPSILLPIAIILAMTVPPSVRALGPLGPAPRPPQL